MHILIVGGDGFIGGHLAQALTSAGHRVTLGVRLGVRRHPNGPDRIACDLAHDRARDWLPRLHGVDRVINAVGIFQEARPGDFTRLHDRGPRRLFLACRRMGVGVIQISALGAEQPSPSSRFLASKRRADEWLLRLGIPALVLLPGLVAGEGGASHALFSALAALPVTPVVDVAALPLIHIDRLCRVVVERIDRLPSPGERLVLAERHPPGEYLGMLRRWLGKRPAPRIRIPMSPLVALFRLFPGLKLGLLDRDSLRMLGGVGSQALPAEGSLEADLAAAPPSPAFRQAAATRFLPGLSIASLVLLWCGSAWCSLANWPVSLELIRAFGVDHPFWGPALIIGGSGVDALLGVALLWRRSRRAALAVQMAVILTYSLLVAAALPELWLHPFAPMVKNLPLLALTLWLYLVVTEKGG